MALDPALERSIHTAVAAPVPVADPIQALDAAVQEVFTCMLGLPFSAQAVPAPTAPSPGLGKPVAPSSTWLSPVSAILGFGGRITGSCTMCAEPAAVAALAMHLLSPALAGPSSAHHAHSMQDGAATHLGQVAIEQLDATLLDSFGEICNMIAGGWKNRVPGLDSGCALSAPTIVCGSSYVLHPLGNQILAERLYLFLGHQIRLSIRCESHPGFAVGVGRL